MWVPFLMYVFVATFTPGPGNLTGFTYGSTVGYKKALPLILGLVTGFFIIMVLSFVVSFAIIIYIPMLESILKWVLASYLIYLAWHTWKPHELATNPLIHSNKRYFWIGLTLQTINVKVMISGVTIFTSLVVPLNLPSHTYPIIILGLTSTSFISISSWALLGTFLNHLFETHRLMLNSLISISLVIVAWMMIW